jgi:hypothetical protein
MADVIWAWKQMKRTPEEGERGPEEEELQWMEPLQYSRYLVQYYVEETS